MGVCSKPRVDLVPEGGTRRGKTHVMAAINPLLTYQSPPAMCNLYLHASGFVGFGLFGAVELSPRGDLGVIGTTFQKKIKKHHLELLLEMANHLEALLLINGTTIVDENTLNKLF